MYNCTHDVFLFRPFIIFLRFYITKYCITKSNLCHMFFTIGHINKEKIYINAHTFSVKYITRTMSDAATLSLHTLPVEIVYRILDKLDQFTMFVSCHSVCVKLNAITDSYHRYQVNFNRLLLYQILRITEISQ